MGNPFTAMASFSIIVCAALWVFVLPTIGLLWLLGGLK